VNDLLDLSRLEAGQLELELADMDLGALVQETLESLEGLAGAKDISLTFTAHQAPLLAKGDPRRIHQVLTNLVGNAIKFSAPHSFVQVVAEQDDSLCTVKIIDTGLGIAAEDLPKLFGKFYQSDTEHKHRGQGSGLGLYIAKQLIEAHGGHMGVESTLGSGSTFLFSIPTQPGSAGQEKPEALVEAS